LNLRKMISCLRATHDILVGLQVEMVAAGLMVQEWHYLGFDLEHSMRFLQGLRFLEFDSVKETRYGSVELQADVCVEQQGPNGDLRKEVGSTVWLRLRCFYLMKE
jgi:hypothetical protein